MSMSCVSLINDGDNGKRACIVKGRLFLKKGSFCIAALICMVLLTACRTGTNSETTAEASPTGFSAEESYVSEPVTFVWEEVGFGGDFVVTLEPFNTFQMCEGPLSSTIYSGYFDVDGDIVTLRDSATSEGFKNFRFRINDDRTELAFIADGSDSLPFCKIEDGALFSTEFHHDISEYWE